MTTTKTAAQAAEYVLVPVEPTLEMLRAAYYPDGSQAHMLAREVSRLRREYKAMLAVAPAIAPGGDDTSTGDDARHARENPPCLPEPTLLYQHDGDGTKVYGYTAAQMTAALAPAAAHAAGDDEQVNAACMSMWGDCFDDSDRKRMRAALLAAQEASRG